MEATLVQILRIPAHLPVLPIDNVSTAKILPWCAFLGSYNHKFYQNYRFLIGFQQEMAFVLLLPMMFLYSMRQDPF